MSTSTRHGLRSSGMLLLLALVALVVWSWPQSFGGRVAYVRVDGHSMDPTFGMGDLAVVRRQSSYQVGDAVAYRIPAGAFGAGAVVIHRLVGGDGASGYVTKGDNRTVKDDWRPRTDDIVGRVRYDVPGAGAKLAVLTRPMYLGGLVAALTVLMMLIPSGSARPARRHMRGRHRLSGPVA